ncbi:MAG TPA: SGNH/GDSL hydrolase family protein [Burkholderiaceae bacterium]|nr:SGNH/GDSL hydrolase family protein [Burkholderiaceae bacterium]
MSGWRRRAWLAAGLLAPAAVSAQSDAQDAPSLRKRIAALLAQHADWPQRARYRAENAALPAPRAGEQRVVFLGDSITDAWGRWAGEFFPGKPYVNRGISGQTTPQMLLRFRADVIALDPRAVVILAGTNDLAGNTGATTLDEIEGNLRSMAELAHAHGIRVVLASVLPVHDHAEPVSATRPPAKILALNAWMRGYAQQHGLVYLDYHAAMVEPDGSLRRELSDDGLHPNAAGYAVMQPLAQRAVDEALRRR